MTQKCCMNCVYLCRVDETGKRQILPDYLRNFDLPEDMQKEAGCYHHQWQALPVDNELGVEPWDLVGNDLNDGEIVDLNGNRISLDAFSCRFFSPFDETKTTLLDRIWQEQQQRQRDARDNLRFWIPTCISITALILAGLSLWRSWE